MVMSENEAIKAIQNDLEWHSKELKPKYKECLRMAIQALADIQQYRAIGTVEEIKHFFNENRSAGYSHGYADAIADLKQRFRNEYEEMMELEMEDCINWADWLDATAEQIMTDRRG